MSAPGMRWAVLGAGAMGTIVGAHLARAGHDVTMLARGERLARIRAQGLRLRGLAEFTVPVRASDDPAALGAVDVLVVTTKAIGTAAALAPFAGVRVGAAFSVQNGVAKNGFLARACGADAVLGALANTSGELEADGTVLFTRNENLMIGEPAGDLGDRAPRIAAALDAAGVRTTAVRDIASHEWSKFAAWIPLVVLALTLRTVSWRYLVDPGAMRALLGVLREVAALAAAEGVVLNDDGILPVATLCREPEPAAVARLVAYGERFRVHAPEHRISTLQDLLAGRPLELAETFGDALARARAHSLPMPRLETLAPLLDAIAVNR